MEIERLDAPGARSAVDDDVISRSGPGNDVTLAVVVPTLNERDNVEPLYRLLNQALTGTKWEVIFVDDDSTDGTLERLHELARANPNVRTIHRIGRRGLAGACIEGMLATTAPYLAVMDADLQHDERLLPVMLEKLHRENLEIVVASRFAEGSDLGTFSSTRERLSRIGISLAHLVLRARLTDPLSGFFVMRRSLLDEVVRRLSGKGFKILLDIFASARRPLLYAEMPFRFRERLNGESKLDTLVSLEFIMLVGDKLFGRFIPIRFLMFVLVGLSGVGVHLLALGLGFKVLLLSFYLSQALATVTAMTTNFYFNNILTHRDRKLVGKDFFKGLLTFYAACAIGAFLNFEVAQFLFDRSLPWLVAGLLGAIIGSVWNYGVTSTFTWKRHKAYT